MLYFTILCVTFEPFRLCEGIRFSYSTITFVHENVIRCKQWVALSKQTSIQITSVFPIRNIVEHSNLFFRHPTMVPKCIQSFTS